MLLMVLLGISKLILEMSNIIDTPERKLLYASYDLSEYKDPYWESGLRVHGYVFGRY